MGELGAGPRGIHEERGPRRAQGRCRCYFFIVADVASCCRHHRCYCQGHDNKAIIAASVAVAAAAAAADVDVAVAATADVAVAAAATAAVAAAADNRNEKRQKTLHALNSGISVNSPVHFRFIRLPICVIFEQVCS